MNNEESQSLKRHFRFGFDKNLPVEQKDHPLLFFSKNDKIPVDFLDQVQSKTFIMLKKANDKISEVLIKYHNLEQKCILYQHKNQTLEKNIQQLISELTAEKQASQLLNNHNLSLQKELDQNRRYYQNMIFQGKRKVQQIISNCRQQNHFLRFQNELLIKKNNGLQEKCMDMRNKIQKTQLENQLLKQNLERIRENQKDNFFKMTIEKISELNSSYEDTYSQDLWEQKYLDLLQMVKFVSDKRTQYQQEKLSCEHAQLQFNPESHNKQRLFSFSGNLKQTKPNFK